jgi:hypothetical protein
MTTLCSKSFTIGLGGLDMGLDAAIYVGSTVDKIFGVRGQWLFQFNSTTGALENSLRFAPNAAGLSSITAIGTKLYISTSMNPNTDFSTYLDPGDIFVVDATTFTYNGRLNFDTVIGGSYRTVGFGPLTTNGTVLQVVLTQAGSGRDTLLKKIISVDPSNLPGFSVGADTGCFTDISYDSTQSLVWMPDSYDLAIYAFNAVVSNYNYGAGLATGPTGITYNLAQNKVYAVQGNKTLFVTNAAAALPLTGSSTLVVTTVDTTRATATPARIKSVNGLAGNPYNGLLLIPCWSDDTVLVWDPATDLVADMVVKTGFTAPFDIVNTPTKSFAVQTGTAGLKEII